MFITLSEHHSLKEKVWYTPIIINTDHIIHFKYSKNIGTVIYMGVTLYVKESIEDILTMIK